MTIHQATKQFLSEKRNKLSPKTMKGYEDTLICFERFLSEHNAGFFEEESSTSVAELSLGDLDYFLNWFAIRKMGSSKTDLRIFGRVLKKFYQWLQERGLVHEEYNDEELSSLTKGAAKARQAVNLLDEFSQENFGEGFNVAEEGYFEIKDRGKETLDLYHSETGKQYRNVEVDSKAIGLLETNWQISGVLGKRGSTFALLEVWNVYP